MTNAIKVLLQRHSGFLQLESTLAGGMLSTDSSHFRPRVVKLQGKFFSNPSTLLTRQQSFLCPRIVKLQGKLFSNPTIIFKI
jgi:hypothetical protein